jgi:pyruvate formate lyase activating enzyme
VRSNRGGTLYLDVHNRVTSRTVVNAEDLPLYHYKPDIGWVQVGSRGCTMRCPFCNTHRYSQGGGAMAQGATPESLVNFAKETRAKGISFGVNEPTHLHEFVDDVFSAARAASLDTHLATNGMWSPDPFRDILRKTSAVTIGLKGFSDQFYQEALGGDLPTIHQNLQQLAAIGVHFEVSWLVIPGRTDSPQEATAFVRFMRDLGAAPPLILLPYQPDFTWQATTQPSTLDHLRAFRTALAEYQGVVYIAHDDASENNTRCLQCGRTLVRRGMARSVVTSHPTGKPKDRCPACNTRVPYIVE